MVRARTFIGEAARVKPMDVQIPVIGGHSGFTIIPVFSQCPVAKSFSTEQVQQLTVRIQEAGTEVVKAKAGAGSATLSMAHSGARFALSLVRAFSGEKNIVEYAYVKSDCSGAPYFATACKLGKNGIEKNFGLPDMNDFENGLLETALPELMKDIKSGEELVCKD